MQLHTVATDWLRSVRCNKLHRVQLHTITGCSYTLSPRIGFVQYVVTSFTGCSYTLSQGAVTHYHRVQLHTITGCSYTLSQGAVTHYHRVQLHTITGCSYTLSQGAVTHYHRVQLHTITGCSYTLSPRIGFVQYVVTSFTGCSYTLSQGAVTHCRHGLASFSTLHATVDLFIGCRPIVFSY